MKTNHNNYLKEQMEHLLKQFMQFIVYSRNMYWGMGVLLAYLLLYKLYEYYPEQAIKTLDIIYDQTVPGVI